MRSGDASVFRPRSPLRRPPSRRPSFVEAALLGVFVLLTALPATAADKLACVNAHEASQQLSLQIRLTDAREQLLICSDSSCPRLVRDDCTKWLSELETQMRSLAEQEPPASGQAPNIAPRFEGHPPTDPAAEPRLAPSVPAAVSSPKTEPRASSFSNGDVKRAPARDSSPTAAESSSTLLPTGAIISGGLGVTAFAAGIYFGVSGWSEARTLRDTCAPFCEDGPVSSARTKLYLADLSLLAGLGFSAVTGWLIWDHHRKDSGAESRPPAPGVSLSADGHHVRLGYRGTF